MTEEEREVIKAAVDVRICYSPQGCLDLNNLLGSVNRYLASQKVAEIEPLDWSGKMFPYPKECQKLVEAMCDLWRKQGEIITAVNKLARGK